MQSDNKRKANVTDYVKSRYSDIYYLFYLYICTLKRIAEDGR
jgi:hypothetical protein